MVRIPDVALLESLYAHSTVRMAPNDKQCATMTFDTGVARKCTVPTAHPYLYECPTRAGDRQGQKIAHFTRTQMQSAVAQAGGEPDS